MDVATFIRHWQSEDDVSYRFDVRDWIQKSYSNPLSFWEDLASLYPIEPPSQTVPLQKYDFYADCILRHLGKKNIALKVIHSKTEADAWTYEQIHGFVNAQAPLWKLKAGQSVALVLPPGLPFLVGLLTALRLGLVISILPFNDRFFPPSQLQPALEQLKPALVVTTPEVELDFKGQILSLDLSLQKQSSTPPPTHAYLPNEIVLQHFNPFAEEKMSPLEAMRCYLIPLRDALIALQLTTSTTWARPLSSLFREEPCCTLMALLAGSTLVHVADNVLLSQPDILKDEPIDILGICPLLQNLWMKHPSLPVSKLKLWYRNPLCGTDQNWKAFHQLNKLQKIPCCQLLIDKERGGITLFSQPKPLQVSFLHPSLGMSWSLLKINRSGDKALGGFGLFHIEPDSGQPDPFIISQVGDEWTLSATTVPLREGYPFPLKIIEEKVKALPFALTCMVVTEPHPHHYHNRQFVLLVFVSPKERLSLAQKQEDWNQKILHLIQTEVGTAFVPEQIQFYSLYPKMKNQQIDRNSVEMQAQNGSLFLKQNRSVYHTLNLLRQLIYETLATK
ncbi:MAG: hypothetical protein JSS10_01590 [Verrucomicrobia bacterium]|nr:hypothetical protein [Verrucomicrobiota bacterium]